MKANKASPQSSSYQKDYISEQSKSSDILTTTNTVSKDRNITVDSKETTLHSLTHKDDDASIKNKFFADILSSVNITAKQARKNTASKIRKQKDTKSDILIAENNADAKLCDTERYSKRKGKRKKVKEELELTESANREVDEDYSLKNSESTYDDKILSIIIHATDRFEELPIYIPHPVVQVYIAHAGAGSLLEKFSKSRNVTPYCENNISFILPVMTLPYNLLEKGSLQCHWDEELVFNELFDYIISSSRDVVLFFQLMDLGVPRKTKFYNNNMSKDALGMKTFAWGFLKLLSASGNLNVGKRLRLQLWRPRKISKVSFSDIFSWWKSGNRVKYPSSLYVTVDSAVPYQENLDSLMKIDGKSKNHSLISPAANNSVSSSDYLENSIPVPLWKRKSNMLCKVPNNVKSQFDISPEGCFVCKFSNDGLKLACVGSGTIVIIDIINNRKLYSLHGHYGLIYDVDWSKNDNYVITASADSTAKVWNIQSSSNSYLLLTHPSYVYCAKFFPNNPKYVVTGCFDNLLRIWKGRCVFTVVQELIGLSYINTLCFNNDGTVLYSGDRQGIIKVWNIHCDKKQLVLSMTKEVKIQGTISNIINYMCCFGEHKLLIQTRNSILRVISLLYWTCIVKFEGNLNMNEQIRGCLSCCGSLVFSGSEDGSVHVWNSDTGETRHVFFSLPYSGTVSCVDFHPFENMIAIASLSSGAPLLMLDYYHDIDQQTIDTVPKIVEPINMKEHLDNDKNIVNKKIENMHTVLRKLDVVLKVAAGDVDQEESSLMQFTSGVLAKVCSPYTAKTFNEISLHRGEIVMVLDKIDSKWCIVQTSDSVSKGHFPCSHLDFTGLHSYIKDNIHSSDDEEVLIVPSTKGGSPIFLSEKKNISARARRHLAHACLSYSSEEQKKQRQFSTS